MFLPRLQKDTTTRTPAASRPSESSLQDVRPAIRRAGPEAVNDPWSGRRAADAVPAPRPPGEAAFSARRVRPTLAIRLSVSSSKFGTQSRCLDTTTPFGPAPVLIEAPAGRAVRASMRLSVPPL